MLRRRVLAAPAAGAEAPGAARLRDHIAGLQRLAAPLVALALLAAARAIVGRFYHVHLMSLALTLLFALALVRLFLYAMRRAFPGNPLLGAFGRSIAALIWIGVALHVSGLLPDLVGLLASVAVSVGTQTISLWTVLRGLFWIFVALLATLWIGSAIESRLMRSTSLHASLRVGLSRLVKALLVLTGILIVLPVVGIDLTVLSVFSGAVGVGLGFGLQKIASNYVSGFIILFDRTVRIGDQVTIESFYGEVRQITTRYVVLRAPDGREAIVPNEKMITETVLNHSLEGRRPRVTLSVVLGHEHDPERCLTMLREVAAGHPAVLADPAPVALVNRFADNGVELELWCWVADVPGGPPIVKSDLSVGLWRRLRQEAMAFARPQREVVIRTDRGSGPDPADRVASDPGTF